MEYATRVVLWISYGRQYELKFDTQLTRARYSEFQGNR